MKAGTSAVCGFPTFTIGLVLLLAGQGWFPGAGTVGLILVIVSCLPLALCVLILVFIGIVSVLIEIDKRRHRRRR